MMALYRFLSKKNPIACSIFFTDSLNDSCQISCGCVKVDRTSQACSDTYCNSAFCYCLQFVDSWSTSATIRWRTAINVTWTSLLFFFQAEQLLLNSAMDSHRKWPTFFISILWKQSKTLMVNLQPDSGQYLGSCGLSRDLFTFWQSCCFTHFCSRICTIMTEAWSSYLDWKRSTVELESKLNLMNVFVFLISWIFQECYHTGRTMPEFCTDGVDDSCFRTFCQWQFWNPGAGKISNADDFFNSRSVYCSACCLSRNATISQTGTVSILLEIADWIK